MRVTHAHPLNPAALAFVPFGIVLVRVQVRVRDEKTKASAKTIAIDKRANEANRDSATAPSRARKLTLEI